MILTPDRKVEYVNVMMAGLAVLRAMNCLAYSVTRHEILDISLDQTTAKHVPKDGS